MILFMYVHVYTKGVVRVTQGTYLMLLCHPCSDLMNTKYCWLIIMGCIKIPLILSFSRPVLVCCLLEERSLPKECGHRHPNSP